MYIIFNHAFLLFQTTCFEHILLPQLLPDSTHPTSYLPFFLSVSVQLELEKPYLSVANSQLVILQRMRAINMLSPEWDVSTIFLLPII